MSRWLIAALLLTSLAGQASPLGTRIVAQAQAHLGQVVGDGECTTLVDVVLKQSGARSLGDFGRYGPDTDYVWGTPIQAKDLQPGDLVQFRDYHLTRRTQDADGTTTKTAQAPHHTAIVMSVDPNGQFTVLEQSVGTPTQTDSLGLSSGTWSGGGRSVTCEVTGKLWFYRPLSK